MRKHFVTFLSPGTFVSESSTKPIEAWRPEAAVQLVRNIIERHGATPFAFYFTTCIVPDEPVVSEGVQLAVVPREVEKSGRHFICGELERWDDVERRNLPSEETLRFNMRGNGVPIVVTGASGYRWTHTFEECDCIVDVRGAIAVRGDEPELVRYRAETVKRWNQAGRN